MRFVNARSAALGLLTLLSGAPGCGSPTGVCTEIGCSSGLLVRLSSLPVGAFTVEVYPQSPSAQTVYRHECTPGATPCGQNVFFTGLVLEQTYVRVTTSLGTVLHERLNLEYETTRPNGPRCEPTCHFAETTVSIPN